MPANPHSVNGGGRRDGPRLEPPAPHFSIPGIDPRGITLPWGKYKGRALGSVPVPYLIWLADTAESPTWRALAARVLGADEGEDDTDPSPDLAAVVLPGVVFRWNQSMVAKYGDDALTLGVVEAGLVVLQNLCSKYTNKPWPSEAGEAA